MNLRGLETMTIDKFYNAYKIGKSYDWQKSGYKGQCVSLVKNYIHDVLEFEPTSFGDAKYYWINRSKAYIRDHFTAYSTGIAKRGDLFVRVSGTYGHIGIVTSADKNGFMAMEQNARGCGYVTHEYHPYSDDMHFLRPKNRKNIDIKVNRPNVKVGKVYTMKSTPYCYKDGQESAIYTVKEILSKNSTIKNNLDSLNPDNLARYKKNTRVTCKAIHTPNGDILIKTPTCYVKLYDYSKDKAYI